MHKATNSKSNPHSEKEHCGIEGFHTVSSNPLAPLTELDHDIRNLNVLFSGVISCDLQDNVLLMIRNGFARDRLDEVTQPVSII
jgi:hypothetical protein